MQHDTHVINAENIIDLPLVERRDLILQSLPAGSDLSEIEGSELLSEIINQFVLEYIDMKVNRDKNRDDGGVLLIDNLKSEFERQTAIFRPTAINELRKAVPTKEGLIKSSKNLYEMSGAIKLSFANKVTRNLSTTMGLLWERMATVSPYAVNPELEFGVKIKGIDLISKNIATGIVEYQQLKTQHNTLTGSQKGRSAQELSIHDNPVFCACFLITALGLLVFLIYLEYLAKSFGHE